METPNWYIQWVYQDRDAAAEMRMVNKIYLAICIIITALVTGCTSQKDNSTRLLFSESLLPEGEIDLYYHKTVHEKNGEIFYGIGAYDSRVEEDTELLKDEFLESVWINEIVATDKLIAYTAFKSKGTHGRGQMLYGVNLSSGERMIIDETEDRFSLYQSDEFILYKREEDETFFLIIGETGQGIKIVPESFYRADGEPDRGIIGSKINVTVGKNDNDETVLLSVRDENHYLVYGRDYLNAEIMMDNNKDYVSITTSHGDDFSYQLNEDAANTISCLSDLKLNTSGVFEEWFCAEGNQIIGKIAEMDYKNGIIYPESMVQSYIRAEYLIEIDPYSETDRILYKTKNNQERIIAYNNRTVYLFKNGMVLSLNVDTEENNILIENLPAEDDLTFAWRNGYLIVFDEDKFEVIGKCE